MAGGFPGGGAALPRNFFLTLDIKMSTFNAVQLPIVQARITDFGLTKLAAAACMQCTAQRQQKAANTSLLESRSLLQTATLVFPRPILCSRLSNNINILAKKIARPPTGGGMAPGPGLDPAVTRSIFTPLRQGCGVLRSTRLSVCLSVCLCVCLSASISLELLHRSSRNFVRTSRGRVARSFSAGVALRYVLPVYG